MSHSLRAHLTAAELKLRSGAREGVTMRHEAPWLTGARAASGPELESVP